MITIQEWGFLCPGICFVEMTVVQVPWFFIITLVLLLTPWPADIPVTAELGCCFISISFLMYCCTLN